MAGILAARLAFTVDTVDIASGWSEQYCQLSKGEETTLQSLKDIEESLPFKVIGVDSDSGGEFINWHLLKYCQATKKYFTRSRPDRKNDNAFIEQKNGARVKIFGQCGGASIRTRFCENYFLGIGFSQKPRLICFLHFVRAEEGSGEESARAEFDFLARMAKMA